MIPRDMPRVEIVNRKSIDSLHRWVMAYNANLDKSVSQRKSVPELRADLKKWEDQRRTNAKRKEKEGVGEDVIGYQVCSLSVFLLCFV